MRERERVREREWQRETDNHRERERETPTEIDRQRWTERRREQEGEHREREREANAVHLLIPAWYYYIWSACRTHEPKLCPQLRGWSLVDHQDGPMVLFWAALDLTTHAAIIHCVQRYFLRRLGPPHLSVSAKCKHR
jgi:hypothetical protein